MELARDGQLSTSPLGLVKSPGGTGRLSPIAKRQNERRGEIESPWDAELDVAAGNGFGDDPHSAIADQVLCSIRRI